MFPFLSLSVTVSVSVCLVAFSSHSQTRLPPYTCTTTQPHCFILLPCIESILLSYSVTTFSSRLSLIDYLPCPFPIPSSHSLCLSHYCFRINSGPAIPGRLTSRPRIEPLCAVSLSLSLSLPVFLYLFLVLSYFSLS